MPVDLEALRKEVEKELAAEKPAAPEAPAQKAPPTVSSSETMQTLQHEVEQELSENAPQRQSLDPQRAYGAAIYGATKELAGLQDLPAEAVNALLNASNFIGRYGLSLATGADPNKMARAPQMPSRAFQTRFQQNPVGTRPETRTEQFIANMAAGAVAMSIPGAGTVRQLTTQAAGNPISRAVLHGLGDVAKRNIARRLDAAAHVARVPGMVSRYGAKRVAIVLGEFSEKKVQAVDRAVGAVLDKAGALGRLTDAAYQTVGGSGYLAMRYFGGAITGVKLPGITHILTREVASRIFSKVARFIENPDKFLPNFKATRMRAALVAAEKGTADQFKAAVILYATDPEFREEVLGSDLAGELQRAEEKLQRRIVAQRSIPTGG